jgi:hypothetical protein
MGRKRDLKVGSDSLSVTMQYAPSKTAVAATRPSSQVDGTVPVAWVEYLAASSGPSSIEARSAARRGSGLNGASASSRQAKSSAPA